MDKQEGGDKEEKVDLIMVQVIWNDENEYLKKMSNAVKYQNQKSKYQRSNIKYQIPHLKKKDQMQNANAHNT